MELFSGFMLRSFIGALVTALLASTIGPLVIWRSQAFLGDTLAHAGLLGVALALLFQLPLIVGIGIMVLVLTFLMIKFSAQRHHSQDTILAILASGFLGLGLLILSLIRHTRVDILNFLYGDILSISWFDVIAIVGCFIIVLLYLIQYWDKLLYLTLHADLATVEGVEARFIHITFQCLVALVIAFGIRLVGVLLIMGLMLIPAATARIYSKGPKKMTLLSILVGTFSVIVGFSGSFIFDTPVGPFVISVAFICFVISELFKRGTHGR